MTIRDIEVLAPNIVAFAVVVLVAIALFVFRRELRGLLKRVRRGKIPGVEIELDEAQKEMKEMSELQLLVEPSAIQSLPTLLPVPEGAETEHVAEDNSSIDSLLEQAGTAPDAAIVRLHLEVEHAICMLASHLPNNPMNKADIGLAFALALLNMVQAADFTKRNVPDEIAVNLVKSLADFPELLKLNNTLRQRLLGLPANDPNVRATMFMFIDGSVRLLNNIRQTSRVIASVLEICNPPEQSKWKRNE